MTVTPNIYSQLTNSLEWAALTEQEKQEIEDLYGEDWDAKPQPSPLMCTHCSAEIIQALATITPHTGLQERITIFKRQLESVSDTNDLCWNHLRLFARLTVGLLTNGLTMNQLKTRVFTVNANIESYEDFVKNKPEWFNSPTRGVIPTDSIAPYKYFHSQMEEPAINPESIFKRLAQPHAFEEWLRDGTIIIPTLCSYLLAPEIRDAVDFEFKLYEHHCRDNIGKPAMGFIRNMFFSGIQQLVRQDPGWYAMQVAARPDNQWRLITYPYVAKSTKPDERTGFLHMDININKFLADGVGASQLTSSISLDDEHEDGCTLVVPGFFRHIGEWNQLRIQRDARRAGTTTDASKSYTREDEEKFGKPIPCPSPAGGIRLTRPNVIHGSTKKTERQRRVIYSWHTSIADDHRRLEIPGQLSWEEIAACHRDLEAPTHGVGGELVKHDRPPFRFPAAVSMNSSTALCDALVGRRKYTDPLVIHEANILLGDDDQAALDYIAMAREKLVRNYLESIRSVRLIEPIVYRNDSFVNVA
jgi:hypothetical protein